MHPTPTFSSSRKLVLHSEAGSLNIVAATQMLGIAEHEWARDHKNGWIRKSSITWNTPKIGSSIPHPLALCIDKSTQGLEKSCKRELLTCPVLFSFLIFSYKCLNLTSHNLKFFQPLHWDYTAGLCSNSIIFIFFAYTVLCLVHFFFTTCILGAAMRYNFVCNSPTLGGKLNCPYESFKLSEFWFHLSLSNKPMSKRETFSKQIQTSSFKSLHTLLWH